MSFIHIISLNDPIDSSNCTVTLAPSNSYGYKLEKKKSTKVSSAPSSSIPTCLTVVPPEISASVPATSGVEDPLLDLGFERIPVTRQVCCSAENVDDPALAPPVLKRQTCYVPKKEEVDDPALAPPVLKRQMCYAYMPDVTPTSDVFLAPPVLKRQIAHCKLKVLAKQELEEMEACFKEAEALYLRFDTTGVVENITFSEACRLLDAARMALYLTEHRWKKLDPALLPHD